MLSYMLFLFFFASAIVVVLAFSTLSQDRQFRKAREENARLLTAVQALEARIKALEAERDGANQAEPAYSRQAPSAQELGISA